MWYLNQTNFERWVTANIFSKEECDKIISDGTKLELETGTTGDFGNYKIDSVRNSNISWIYDNNEKFEWVFRRLTDVCLEINRDFWNFDLSYFEALQFTVYDSSKQNQRYGAHVDIQQNAAGYYRKLSFAIPLNSDFEGGDFVFHDVEGGRNVDLSAGQGIIFPSFFLHEVKPVTSGCRYSLVAWCSGPPFK